MAVTDEVVGGTASKLSAVVTNGRIMLALRRGQPMWARQTNGVFDCQVCRDAGSHASSGSPAGSAGGRAHTEGRRVNHDHLRAVLLISRPTGAGAIPAGFEEVPEASIVAVSRDLQKSLVPLANPAA